MKPASNKGGKTTETTPIQTGPPEESDGKTYITIGKRNGRDYLRIRVDSQAELVSALGGLWKATTELVEVRKL